MGIEVSKLRKKLREHALSLDESEALDQGKEVHEVSRLAQRINDGAAKKQMLKPDFSEPVPAGLRKRSRKRGPLSIGNKIDIVYRVLINFEK